MPQPIRSKLKSLVWAATHRVADAIWEAEGRPEGQADEHWRRARAEVEREFRQRVSAAGFYRHRWNPLLEIEEALTPGHSREPGGLKWHSSHPKH